jgi:radical SAM superfamily enzyme YgiQ (UPF0313 family)
LLSIEKPARYLGGEWNQAAEKPEAEIRVCLAYPDLYELGMSNVALKILYQLLDEHPGVAVERVFSPWIDFEALLRKKGLPLRSLETKLPIREFDVLGITLPYEMTYTNILNLLDLSGIPLHRQERTSGPLVVGGGPSAGNPLPMADFFDAILIGDGEEAIIDIAEAVMAGKRQHLSRMEVCEALSAVAGVYVPAFPKGVRRRVFKGFRDSPPPLRPLVSSVESIHDRIPLEIFRGCIQGCRFCHAGYFYRPKRERRPEKLVEWAREIAVNTGDEKLGLISLSTSDYSCLHALLNDLGREMPFAEQVISVPSLRMNAETLNLLEKTPTIRKSGLTFAPEAGSQRMRDIIHKNLTAEEIFKVIRGTRSSMYRNVKLYFMIGLPFEEKSDIDAIVTMIQEMEDLIRREKLQKDLSISLSGFVPKPFTPFQWSRQISPDELRERRLAICHGLSRSRAKLSWRSEHLCRLEGVLSRGDQRVGKLIETAWRKGCRFDGWTDHFQPRLWEEAFEETGISDQEYLSAKVPGKPLPWDFIDFLVPGKFLADELAKAQELAGEGKEGIPRHE